MRFILKPILHLAALIIYRVKKVGEKNIPQNGRYILCGNHVHALDAPVIVVVAKRRIRFIAKEELYKNKIYKWIGGVFDVITIKRGSADMDAMKKSIKALNNEEMIGIFPEGTRHGMDKNVEFSVYDLIINDEIEPSDTIQKTELKNLSICPSNINLAGAEVELVTMMSREYRMKEKLDIIKD